MIPNSELHKPLSSVLFVAVWREAAMPIRVADYRWDQNEEQVVITVPLKGARAAKADVYCNSLLVKVGWGLLLLCRCEGGSGGFGSRRHHIAGGR